MQIKLLRLLPWGIIIILIIALSITQCSKQKQVEVNHEAELKQAINLEKARVIDLRNREEALRLKIDKDSVKSIESHKAYNREIKALKYRLSIARMPVINLIDSIPELNRFTDLQDSTINLQDNRIDSLEYEKAEQWAKFNALLQVCEEKESVQVELVENLDQLNKDLNKSVKRERRKKTVFKIVAGVLATGIIYQSIKD